MNFRRPFFLLLLLLTQTAQAQEFTRQDSLRGGNGRGRDWWDVQHYNLIVDIQPETKSVTGSVQVQFKVAATARDSMQIDLQEGLEIDSALLMGQKVLFTKESNVYWLILSADVRAKLANTNTGRLWLYYHGTPRSAKNPPWDGGFVWREDENGKPWIAVACQGLGASSWWPCKDDQRDEPDAGMTVDVTAPENLTVISNGRVAGKVDPVTHKVYSRFRVNAPINLYDITFYIGDYSHWTETYKGESGPLTLDFYALSGNEKKARKQFTQAKTMLECFEHWLGPYPFYEDGYKLVEAPYLGMEHQSAVAYGNKFQKGYLGQDISGTGEGLKFDYIIVHESGHEWFGNSITAKDVADNWIHEGLCTYTEVLYLEWIDSKEAAYRYMRGRYNGIQNTAPVIGPYGVNKEGEDIYEKGAAVIHMVRLMMDDDTKFRQLLRGMNKEFYHQTVTTKQIEDYIEKISGLDLKAFFNVYLRSTDIPTLYWYTADGQLHFRWEDAPAGFIAPVTIQQDGREKTVMVRNGVMKAPFAGEVEISASGLYQVDKRRFRD